jgi:hypothetical protein
MIVFSLLFEQLQLRAALHPSGKQRIHVSTKPVGAEYGAVYIKDRTLNAKTFFAG